MLSNKFTKKLHKFSFRKIILLGIVFPGILLLATRSGVLINKDKNRVSDISIRELSDNLQNKDFIFINVHTPYEGEIQKTDLFIEYDFLIASKEKLPKDKEARIILYCKTGSMSKKAAQTLKGLGYKNVSHLSGGMEEWKKAGYQTLDLSKLVNKIASQDMVTLPFSWKNTAKKLVETGVIDYQKYGELMSLTDEQRLILTKGSDSLIKIDNQNSRFILNTLWALGLAQRSLVYEVGPMGTTYKDTKGNFASTGGWTLSKGNATNYLGKLNLINLTQDEQQRVYEIASNINRPCCGNHTAFPDCNHGMAALAAIELLVSEGKSEGEIYKYILSLNSMWFPDTYLYLATYFERQGIKWDAVDAKTALGNDYSSAQGAARIYKEVGDLPYQSNQGGGACQA